jgi:hypothetical protein
MWIARVYDDALKISWPPSWGHLKKGKFMYARACYEVCT